MAAKYTIGGVTFRRRCLVKLAGEERAWLAENGSVRLRVPVEWPLPGRVPAFEEAYIDPGGTPIWGPGPCLKVPNYSEDPDDRLVNRVFCPWGYPPARVRVARTAQYLQLRTVELERVGEAPWDWVLTLKPWLA